jgi:hypothetical protein
LGGFRLRFIRPFLSGKWIRPYHSADTTSGSFQFDLIQTVTVQAQTPLPQLPTMSALPDTVQPLIMDRDTRWLTEMRSTCIGQGLKAFFGGVIMKKEIDTLGNLAMGDSSTSLAGRDYPQLRRILIRDGFWTMPQRVVRSQGQFARHSEKRATKSLLRPLLRD